LSLPDRATLICPNSIFGVANQPTDQPSVLPGMRIIRLRANLLCEEAIMAKNKNRNQQRTPRPTSGQPSSPDTQKATEQPADPGTPAGMPRKRQRRFGHN
jgi:hypothetical protein